ncbi:MAG: hypothetical protein AAB453_00850 [Patescibacteria group bacterium]
MDEQNQPKSWPLWLIILAFLVLLSISVLGLLSNQKVDENPVTKNSDISDWLTYQNDEYGFEFRYPSNWKLSKNEWNAGESFGVFSPETNMDKLWGTDSLTNYFLISIGYKDVTGRNFVDSGWGISELGGGSFRLVKINEAMEIKMSALDKENLEILDQIYSTFKINGSVPSGIFSNFSDTSDWPIDTVSKNGVNVAFRYPLGWGTSKDGVGVFIYDPASLDLEFNPPAFRIQILDNLSKQSLDDFFKTYREGWYSRYASTTSVKVDGHPAIYANDLSVLPSLQPSPAAFISVSNFIVYVSSLYRTESEFLPILSSLDISTTSGVDISNWKTYRNSDFGFEFKYPDFGFKSMVKESETPENLFLDVQFDTDPKHGFVGQFGFTILNNNDKLSAPQWFAKNIDLTGTLIPAKSFTLVNLANDMSGYYFTGPVTSEHLDNVGPVSMFYMISPDKNKVVIAGLSQIHDFYEIGLTPSEQVEMIKNILSTFKFTN